MIYFEDGFINYALHRNAKSLYLMKNVNRKKELFVCFSYSLSNAVPSGVMTA